MIIHKRHTTLLNHNKWEKKEIPINCFTQSGATWWKATHFPLLKIKKMPRNFSPNIIKIDCTDIIVSFKDMFDVSAVLLQNAFETTWVVVWRRGMSQSHRRHHSLMPRLTARQVSNPEAQSLLLGRPWTTFIFLSCDTHVRCCRRFYSATWPDWFCLTSYAVSP